MDQHIPSNPDEETKQFDDGCGVPQFRSIAIRAPPSVVLSSFQSAEKAAHLVQNEKPVAATAPNSSLSTSWTDTTNCKSLYVEFRSPSDAD
jgi:hypothetical protein